MSVEIELHYAGYHSCESVCDVRIEHGTAGIMVTVTERPTNPGTSITNAIETIATQIARTMPSANMPDVRFVEHYPGARWDQDHLRCRAETFDLVEFTWSESREASAPRWRHLGPVGYIELRAELGIEDD